MLRMCIEELVDRALHTLNNLYGIRCDVDARELLEYLSGPTYEEDTIGFERIARNELLFLHEVAEICILKSWGFEIGRDTVVKAYPRTYAAHLEAMEIELREALRRGAVEHLGSRCRDLETYLEDPYLPQELEDRVRELLSLYCKILRAPSP